MCEIYDDGERAEASRQTWRKARKQHRCFSCDAPICVGDCYLYASWIFDGCPGSEKVCAPCAEDIDAFGKAHNYWPCAEYFEERLEECIAEGDEESETKWKPMLARIKARNEAAKAAP